MGKRKLGKKDIGEGFHDGALEVAQKKLHRHAEQLAGRHHAHLSRTMTVGAGVLHRARKQGKKALNQAKDNQRGNCKSPCPPRKSHGASPETPRATQEKRNQ